MAHRTDFVRSAHLPYLALLSFYGINARLPHVALLFHLFQHTQNTLTPYSSHYNKYHQFNIQHFNVLHIQYI